MNLHTSHQPGTPFFEQDWLRWIKVLPLSVVATAALVVSMERLIATSPVEIPEVPDYVIPEIVMPEREIAIHHETDFDKPPESEPLPDIPPPPLDLASNIDNTLAPPMLSRKIEPPVLGSYGSNIPVPTVMVQADYPARALARGIEGYVDVAFDVTASGTTINLRIVSAHPEQVFDKAALRAVKNWKFSPVVVNGEPQLYQGLQKRLVFEMEES